MAAPTVPLRVLLHHVVDSCYEELVAAGRDLAGEDISSRRTKTYQMLFRLRLRITKAVALVRLLNQGPATAEIGAKHQATLRMQHACKALAGAGAPLAHPLTVGLGRHLPTTDAVAATRLLMAQPFWERVTDAAASAAPIKPPVPPHALPREGHAFLQAATDPTSWLHTALRLRAPLQTLETRTCAALAAASAAPPGATLQVTGAAATLHREGVYEVRLVPAMYPPTAGSCPRAAWGVTDITQALPGQGDYARTALTRNQVRRLAYGLSHRIRPLALDAALALLDEFMRRMVAGTTLLGLAAAATSLGIAAAEAARGRGGSPHAATVRFAGAALTPPSACQRLVAAPSAAAVREVLRGARRHAPPLPTAVDVLASHRVRQAQAMAAGCLLFAVDTLPLPGDSSLPWPAELRPRLGLSEWADDRRPLYTSLDDLLASSLVIARADGASAMPSKAALPALLDTLACGGVASPPVRLAGRGGEASALPQAAVAAMPTPLPAALACVHTSHAAPDTVCWTWWGAQGAVQAAFPTAEAPSLSEALGLAVAVARPALPPQPAPTAGPRLVQCPAGAWRPPDPRQAGAALAAFTVDGRGVRRQRLRKRARTTTGQGAAVSAASNPGHAPTFVDEVKGQVPYALLGDRAAAVLAAVLPTWGVEQEGAHPHVLAGAQALVAGLQPHLHSALLHACVAWERYAAGAMPHALAKVPQGAAGGQHWSAPATPWGELDPVPAGILAFFEASPESVGAPLPLQQCSLSLPADAPAFAVQAQREAAKAAGALDECLPRIVNNALFRLVTVAARCGAAAAVDSLQWVHAGTSAPWTAPAALLATAVRHAREVWQGHVSTQQVLSGTPAMLLRSSGLRSAAGRAFLGAFLSTGQAAVQHCALRCAELLILQRSLGDALGAPAPELPANVLGPVTVPSSVAPPAFGVQVAQAQLPLHLHLHPGQVHLRLHSMCTAQTTCTVLKTLPGDKASAGDARGAGMLAGPSLARALCLDVEAGKALESPLARGFVGHLLSRHQGTPSQWLVLRAPNRSLQDTPDRPTPMAPANQAPSRLSSLLPSLHDATKAVKRTETGGGGRARHAPSGGPSTSPVLDSMSTLPVALPAKAVKSISRLLAKTLLCTLPSDSATEQLVTAMAPQLAAVTSQWRDTLELAASTSICTEAEVPPALLAAKQLGCKPMLVLPLPVELLVQQREQRGLHVRVLRLLAEAASQAGAVALAVLPQGASVAAKAWVAAATQPQQLDCHNGGAWPLPVLIAPTALHADLLQQAALAPAIVAFARAWGHGQRTKEVRVENYLLDRARKQQAASGAAVDQGTHGPVPKAPPPLPEGLELVLPPGWAWGKQDVQRTLPQVVLNVSGSRGRFKQTLQCALVHDRVVVPCAPAALLLAPRVVLPREDLTPAQSDASVALGVLKQVQTAELLHATRAAIRRAQAQQALQDEGFVVTPQGDQLAVAGLGSLQPGLARAIPAHLASGAAGLPHIQHVRAQVSIAMNGDMNVTGSGVGILQAFLGTGQ